jgi:hypothetical protein
LERPEPVNVEEIFNRFVLEQGGTLVSSIIPKNTALPNADYYFSEFNFIAELKCLQKDSFNNGDDIPRLISQFEKWLDNGTLNEADFFEIIFKGKRLPESCLLDLHRLAIKTIDRSVYYANKQIRETKKLLASPQAKGILFFVNDGNYFLSHNSIIKALADLLSKKYPDSEIDAAVYLTVNQVSYLPESDLDWQIWMPMYKEDIDNDLLWKFINGIGRNFYNVFLPKITGQPLLSEKWFEEIEDAANALRGHGYIPKEIAFKTKKTS